MGRIAHVDATLALTGPVSFAFEYDTVSRFQCTMKMSIAHGRLELIEDLNVGHPGGDSFDLLRWRSLENLNISDRRGRLRTFGFVSVCSSSLVRHPANARVYP